jgi:hypothetical protein
MGTKATARSDSAQAEPSCARAAGASAGWSAGVACAASPRLHFGTALRKRRWSAGRRRGPSTPINTKGQIEMPSTSGVYIDTMIQIDGNCQIEYDVIRDEVELRLGGRSNDGVTLVLGLQALDSLVVAAAHAGHEVRANAETEPAARDAHLRSGRQPAVDHGAAAGQGQEQHRHDHAVEQHSG